MAYVLTEFCDHRLSCTCQPLPKKQQYSAEQYLADCVLSITP